LYQQTKTIQIRKNRYPNPKNQDPDPLKNRKDRVLKNPEIQTEKKTKDQILKDQSQDPEKNQRPKS
jgi:hypothetical protein